MEGHFGRTVPSVPNNSPSFPIEFNSSETSTKNMKMSNSRERINIALLPGWHSTTTRIMKAIRTPLSPHLSSKSPLRPREATSAKTTKVSHLNLSATLR